MADFGKEKIPELSDFPFEQRSVAVELLLGICQRQQREIVELREQITLQAEQLQLQAAQLVSQKEEIARLKDQIAILKGEKGRPTIKPSGLDKAADGQPSAQSKRGKPGCSKTRELKIHYERVIEPTGLPVGSKFKGYKAFVVQDIELKLSNTRYLRARYETPDGQEMVGQLPVAVAGSHFGPTLRSYILTQYYQSHVPQNLILQQLWEIGVRISSGEMNRIITENHEAFHTEKSEILRVGLEVSAYINVDDTGARHCGKNGFCTQVGNELFTWFSSTSSKSRINFLELLRADVTEYVVDDLAREYMRQQRMPPARLRLLANDQTFCDQKAWQAHLVKLGLNKRCSRIATEGALVACLLKHGNFLRLVIMSDDAPQFNILGFLNALCWVHAERSINRIIPFMDNNRQAQELIQDQIWCFYRDLKAYKLAPTAEMKNALARRFDEIFTQKTCFQTLNLALQRLHKNKNELLLVLERPEIPLHNNLSENDIRDYVKKRKISATTRSDLGRKARDTMLSLKKTCQKLGISFQRFVLDRVSKQNSIPPLADLIRAAAQGP
jgi:hypothetical protein